MKRLSTFCLVYFKDERRNSNFEGSRNTADEHFPAEEGANSSLPAAIAESDDNKDTEPETSSSPEREPLYVTVRSRNEAHREESGPSSVSNGAQPVFNAVANQTQQCMSCDGGATNSSKTSTAGESSPNTTTQAPVANFVLRSCLNLPSLPDSSLEDGKSGRYGKVEHTLPGRSPQEKSPRENVCEVSFQVPSPGMTIRIFLMEKTCTERNEKTFYLYMIPEGDCKVYEDICREFKDGEGFSRQIPFTVNGSRSQDFYSLYVREKITVQFEIENITQESFIPLNGGNESVFRVPVIKSESKNRLAKGSKCQFVVQYVGECGKACQEQGKATLTIDSTNQTTLFFSISFWSSTETQVDTNQPEETQ